ncbi:hypothetical protein A2U01_0053607, partial [Trifolium medium]|nr:hypothetical protein [Trifolium medium]
MIQECNPKEIEVDDTDELNFQGLSLDDKNDKKKETVMSSLKDAQEVLKNGSYATWGKVVVLPENKHRKGLGFSPASEKVVESSAIIKSIEDTFYSAGFIHPPLPEVNAIVEDDPEEDLPSFVTRGV